MSRPPKRRTRSTAFTLVEVLIVVVILGILAGTMVGLIRGKAAEAREVALEQQFQRIEQAIALHQQRTGNAPSRLAELATAAGERADAISLITLRETRDPWGNAFVYDPFGGGAGYSLLSYGSDGLPGGLNDAADRVR